ncbi:Receptor-type tyrosine-protein phosphatase beta [Nymphon striatum]|nr:Receptor-type tyrosine-protein phosphatase beta [Nymphon striatum]
MYSSDLESSRMSSGMPFGNKITHIMGSNGNVTSVGDVGKSYKTENSSTPSKSIKSSQLQESVENNLIIDLLNYTTDKVTFAQNTLSLIRKTTESPKNVSFNSSDELESTPETKLLLTTAIPKSTAGTSSTLLNVVKSASQRKEVQNAIEGHDSENRSTTQEDTDTETSFTITTTTEGNSAPNDSLATQSSLTNSKSESTLTYKLRETVDESSHSSVTEPGISTKSYSTTDNISTLVSTADHSLHTSTDETTESPTNDEEISTDSFRISSGNTNSISREVTNELTQSKTTAQVISTSEKGDSTETPSLVDDSTPHALTKDVIETSTQYALQNETSSIVEELSTDTDESELTSHTSAIKITTTELETSTEAFGTQRVGHTDVTTDDLENHSTDHVSTDSSSLEETISTDTSRTGLSESSNTSTEQGIFSNSTYGIFSETFSTDDITSSGSYSIEETTPTGFSNVSQSGDDETSPETIYNTDTSTKSVSTESYSTDDLVSSETSTTNADEITETTTGQGNVTLVTGESSTDQLNTDTITSSESYYTEEVTPTGSSAMTSKSSGNETSTDDVIEASTENITTLTISTKSKIFTNTTATAVEPTETTIAIVSTTEKQSSIEPVSTEEILSSESYGTEEVTPDSTSAPIFTSSTTHNSTLTEMSTRSDESSTEKITKQEITHSDSSKITNTVPSITEVLISTEEITTEIESTHIPISRATMYTTLSEEVTSPTMEEITNSTSEKFPGSTGTHSILESTTFETTTATKIVSESTDFKPTTAWVSETSKTSQATSPRTLPTEVHFSTEITSKVSATDTLPTTVSTTTKEIKVPKILVTVDSFVGVTFDKKTQQPFRIPANFLQNSNGVIISLAVILSGAGRMSNLKVRALNGKRYSDSNIVNFTTGSEVMVHSENNQEGTSTSVAGNCCWYFDPSCTYIHRGYIHCKTPKVFTNSNDIGLSRKHTKILPPQVVLIHETCEVWLMDGIMDYKFVQKKRQSRGSVSSKRDLPMTELNHFSQIQQDEFTGLYGSVRCCEFKEHVRKLMKDSALLFSTRVHGEVIKERSSNLAMDDAKLEENRRKNRWINILPYDTSRVKLLPIADEPCSDYVNASYIPFGYSHTSKGFHSQREYIATQGPLPQTVDDFWRLVWEQEVFVIVMVTQCVERGKTKCEQYWPDNQEPEHYGDLRITMTSESILSNFSIRVFLIQLVS